MSDSFIAQHKEQLWPLAIKFRDLIHTKLFNNSSEKSSEAWAAGRGIKGYMDPEKSQKTARRSLGTAPSAYE